MRADMANVPFGQKRRDVLARIDDDEAGPVEVEMTFDQRKSAAPDGAEADHDDGAVNIAVNRVVCVRHSSIFLFQPISKLDHKSERQ